jgi:hypothetical protein
VNAARIRVRVGRHPVICSLGPPELTGESGVESVTDVAERVRTEHESNFKFHPFALGIGFSFCWRESFWFDWLGLG